MASPALSVEIIYTLSCALVDLIVLFLNPIIISLIYNNRQLRKLPSITYIVNLAIVDLCLAGVNFINIIFHFLRIMKMYPICLLFHGYFPFTLINASLLFMFTNSVDRFIFIKMSMKYHSIMNQRIAKLVAIAIWIYSLAFPLLPYVILEQAWNYKTCSDMTGSKPYRYAHIPIQLVFFTTIIFTALMFISVFRVVKNSRRLRHVPTRSTSLDSMSTTLSSPSWNISSPSLPPISELIPYEHGQSQDCQSQDGQSQDCQTATACADSKSKSRPLFQEEEQCSLPTATHLTDKPRNKPDDSFRNVKRRLTFLEVNHVGSESDKNTQTGTVTESPNTRNRREHSPVMFQSFNALPDILKEAANEETIVVGTNDPEEANMNLSEMVSYSDNDYLHDHSASSNQSPSCNVVVSNKFYHLDMTGQDIRKQLQRKDMGRRSIKSTEKLNKKLTLKLKESSVFNPHIIIKTAESSRVCRCRLKTSSEIPSEVLKMVDFKFQTCSSDEQFQRSDNIIHETSLTRSDRSSFLISGHKRLDERFQFTSGRELLPNQYPKKPHIRIRRRTISTTSSGSGSSYSNATTESTLTTTESTLTYESGHTSLQNTNNLSVDFAHFHVSDTDLSVDDFLTTQLGSNNSLADFSLNTNKILCNRSPRMSPDRPHRPHRLPLRNSPVSSPDSPRLSPGTQARKYGRTISTSSSRASSIPFGSPSYSGRDIRTLKILFLMFCVYIILWLPAFIMQVLRYFSFDISLELILIGYTFAVSNSVFNFFVYPMRIPKLRVSFKQQLQVSISEFKKNANCIVSKFQRRFCRNIQ